MKKRDIKYKLLFTITTLMKKEAQKDINIALLTIITLLKTKNANYA